MASPDAPMKGRIDSKSSRDDLFDDQVEVAVTEAFEVAALEDCPPLEPDRKKILQVSCPLILGVWRQGRALPGRQASRGQSCARWRWRVRGVQQLAAPPAPPNAPSRPSSRTCRQ